MGVSVCRRPATLILFPLDAAPIALDAARPVLVSVDPARYNAGSSSRNVAVDAPA